MKTTKHTGVGQVGKLNKSEETKQPEITASTSTWRATVSIAFPLELRYFAMYDYSDAMLRESYKLWEPYQTLFCGRTKWRQKSTWRYPDGGKAYSSYNFKRAVKLAKDFNLIVPKANTQVITVDCHVL